MPDTISDSTTPPTTSTRHSLEISKILVENRQRTDYGDLDDLADSLLHYGLIQPIVVNQQNRLIAGGRRLAAASLCGWTHIDVVYRETLTEDELHELELEENVRRKDMHWTERVLNIKTIHDLKKRRGALNGERWGMRETAELLNIKGQSNVHYAIVVAEELQKDLDKKSSPLWSCDSLTSAWKEVLLRREEDRILAELSRRTLAGDPASNALALPPSASTLPSEFLPAESTSLESPAPLESPCSEQDADRERALAEERYRQNPLNDPEKFDEYYEEYKALRAEREQHQRIINLSYMLRQGDCIDFMRTHPEAFDHIITDIPYGIDMDMLKQQNHDNVCMKDIDTVLTEHTVEGNESLFRAFFPAAFSTLKPNAFLVTWCDAWQFRYMADLAISAGFKVQRWPYVWVKTHSCMNQSANTNFTKTFEIALVCRKGTTTLMQPNLPSHVLASHDDYKEKLGHPFVKPYEVWTKLIDAVSFQGQLILEPFAGRGSGVISLLRKNRRVIACELNIEHYNALRENVRTYYTDISSNFTFA